MLFGGHTILIFLNLSYLTTLKRVHIKPRFLFCHEIYDAWDLHEGIHLLEFEDIARF